LIDLASKRRIIEDNDTGNSWPFTVKPLALLSITAFWPQPYHRILFSRVWETKSGVRLVEQQIGAVPDETESLVRLAKAGDVAAFERLVAQQYRFIYKTAFRWLGHKSDAEDVTQSVCLRLPDALPGFDGRSKFTSWLYRITLNAVRDLQRTHQRRGRQVYAVAAMSSEEVEATQEDQLRVNDIWRIVRQLPEKQRDAVLLVFGEEMSQAEAARIMGCKEVTVSWHIHNARKALKDLL